MRFNILLIIAIILMSVTVFASDKKVFFVNPFTGEFDAHSGISKLAYDSSPTLTSLRDALISAGIMDAAPVVAEAGGAQHFSRTDGYHFDRTGGTHFDR